MRKLKIFEHISLDGPREHAAEQYDLRHPLRNQRRALSSDQYTVWVFVFQINQIKRLGPSCPTRSREGCPESGPICSGTVASARCDAMSHEGRDSDLMTRGWLQPKVVLVESLYSRRCVR
jgi:hypothetical protein